MINKTYANSGSFAVPVLEDEILTFDGYEGEIDISEHEGKRIAVSTDKDGNLSVDAPTDYWLLAEIDIPTAETVTIGEGEEATSERVPIEEIEVRLWALP
jgi:hypothetical protein